MKLLSIILIILSIILALIISGNIKSFIECGPGRVLQGLVKKINRDSDVSSL